LRSCPLRRSSGEILRAFRSVCAAVRLPSVERTRSVRESIEAELKVVSAAPSAGELSRIRTIRRSRPVDSGPRSPITSLVCTRRGKTAAKATRSWSTTAGRTGGDESCEAGHRGMPRVAGDTVAPRWRRRRCLRAASCCRRTVLRPECGTRIRAPIKAVDPAPRAAARPTTRPQPLAVHLRARAATAVRPARRTSIWSFGSARMSRVRINAAAIPTAQTATRIPAPDRPAQLRAEPHPARRRAGPRVRISAQAVQHPPLRPALPVKRCPAFRSPSRINRETS